MQDVASRSAGATRLLPGTLYRAVARLVEDGLLEESDERAAPGQDDERRRVRRDQALGWPGGR